MGVEVLLLVIGVVFYIASFFVTEKLGPSELDKIREMSNREMQGIMERELQKVTGEIASRVEEEADKALVQSEISMEKECGDKIKAIDEYANTVVESMNKTHNEIMFLYSMLNDKHTELTEFSAKLQKLQSDLSKKEEEISNRLAAHTLPPLQKEEIIPEAKPPVFQKEDDREALFSQEEMDDVSEAEETNHNAEILYLYQEGKTTIEIARELSLGLGEVQLVIGLYEREKK